MATSALIGALRVTLGLDTAAFEDGAKKAAGRSTKLEQEIRGSLGKISSSMSALTAIGGGLAATIAGLGFVTAAKEALEYASSLAEVAQQLGVSSRTLQEYRYIGSQVGIDNAQMDAGLQKLTRSIGMAAEGSKKQQSAFAELGISVRDANGHIKTTDDLLPELVAKFSAMPDAAKRATLEVALFGKTGQQLDTMLSAGTKEVDRLRKAAEDLGLVLSDEQIDRADRAADKWTEVKNVLASNIARVVADNADSIFRLADALERVASSALKAIGNLSTARNMNILENPGGNQVSAWLKGKTYGQLSEDARNDLIKTSQGRVALYGFYERARDSGEIGPEIFAAQTKPIVAAQRTYRQAQRSRASRGGGSATISDDASQGGGGRRLSRGGGGRGTRSPEDNLQQIIDSYLPDDAERRKIEADAAALRAALARGGLSKEQFDRVIGNLDERYDKVSGIPKMVLPDNENPDFGIPKSAKIDLIDMTHLLDNVKVTNGDVRESFVDMARDAASSLQNLAGAIRGGGLLDIMGSLLDAFLTLGQAGVFGGKISTGLKSGLAGARAMGGPVDGGRTYLVGERGPELFTAPGAGRIVPNGAFGGGAPVSFDLRGAVMTADLVGQMQVIANDTGGRLVTANNATLMKRSRQRLGR